MAIREEVYFAHAYAWPVESKKLTNSGTSATYQATGDSVGKLHFFVSAVDSMLEGGTGSSVTVTNGFLVKAGVPWVFRPVSGRESLGYKTLSGGAYSAADIATVGKGEP